MGFGPRESPNPGLLPPRGDKASTTIASLGGSLYSTRGLTGTENTNSSSKSHLSLLNSSEAGSRELGFSHQQDAPLERSANTKSEDQLRYSGSLSTTGVLVAEMSSTIRGTFRATKSQGLFPSCDLDGTREAKDACLATQEDLHGSRERKLSVKHQALPKPSDEEDRSVSLSSTSGSCAATITGTFRATKSQGLFRNLNELEKTSNGTQLHCSHSLSGTTSSATTRSERRSSNSGRERDILSGTAKGTTDT